MLFEIVSPYTPMQSFIQTVLVMGKELYVNRIIVLHCNMSKLATSWYYTFYVGKSIVDRIFVK